MKKAVYPGTFDPITNGHLDVIERASKLVEELHIVVGQNVNKVPTFSAEERMDMIKMVTSHIPNLVISTTEDLIVRYAKKNKIELIIRGLRNFQDYEMEYTLHQFNKNIYPDIETMIIFPSSLNQFISSSSIKELVFHNADISLYIPEKIIPLITKRIAAKLETK